MMDLSRAPRTRKMNLISRTKGSKRSSPGCYTNMALAAFSKALPPMSRRAGNWN